jgi:hypothetical protein
LTVVGVDEQLGAAAIEGRPVGVGVLVVAAIGRPGESQERAAEGWIDEGLTGRWQRRRGRRQMNVFIGDLSRDLARQRTGDRDQDQCASERCCRPTVAAGRLARRFSHSENHQQMSHLWQ